MIKEEIIKLLELRKRCTLNEPFGVTDNILSPTVQSYKIPTIITLRAERNILLDEMKSRANDYIACYKELNNLNNNCDHQVRLKKNYLFCHESTCVICGKKLSREDDISTYYCSFPDDYIDEDLGLIKGVSLKRIEKYIEKILGKKLSDQDVNLVSELRKLRLKKIEIMNGKKLVK